MKNFFLLISICLFSVQTFARTETDSVLQNLFYTIKHKSAFDSKKEEKILQIKKSFNIPDLSDNQQYNINFELQNEFQSYKIDSAIIYLKKNLSIATRLNNLEYIYCTKLTLAYMYWQTGRFFESLQLVKSVNRAQISSELLGDYFEAHKRIYRYYADFQNDTSNDFFEKSGIYRDSLMSVIDCKSKKYEILRAEILTEQHQTQQAAQIVEKWFAQSLVDSHDRAVLANILANIYWQEGNKEQQIKYFAISAICDIKNSVKENASMLSLSLLLYQSGDINNAYHCLQSAMDDAAFCKARFRTYEITEFFPIIDNAYKQKIANQQKKLKVYLLLVSVLSLFLTVTIIFVYRNLKRIGKIRKELYRANLKLQELNNGLKLLNTQLNSANSELLLVNKKLSETNLVKETYLVKFIDLCSNYIEKLDGYRRSLNKFAKDGKTEKLFEQLKSSNFIQNELKDFFTNFDETFLRIFPTFIDDFNALFSPAERQTPKADEILNTELRIFALIRLGINDSSRIALFLRFSITTVYTYRSKLKNKSFFKDSFEDEIMKIGG
ncbi:MAG: DUF6377 domain-containing protein [Prevotellaceae bacterium]|jgi:hypothetical protein|nr:DUF6377 domain-containing protein [Prevotellaceae bacterium]